MIKHTKGPWIARQVGGAGFPGQIGYAIDFNEDQEQVVDFVYEEADARLIAASPDLLEACQAFSRLYGRLLDVTEPSGAGFLSPESVKEYDAIHQLMTVAINKATA